MRPFVILTISATLIGCSDPTTPVNVTTVSDTFCARTTTYRATEAQKTELRRNETLWKPWVDWTLAINDQRERICK